MGGAARGRMLSSAVPDNAHPELDSWSLFRPEVPHLTPAPLPRWGEGNRFSQLRPPAVRGMLPFPPALLTFLLLRFFPFGARW